MEARALTRYEKSVSEIFSIWGLCRCNLCLFEGVEEKLVACQILGHRQAHPDGFEIFCYVYRLKT